MIKTDKIIFNPNQSASSAFYSITEFSKIKTLSSNLRYSPGDYFLM